MDSPVIRLATCYIFVSDSNWRYTYYFGILLVLCISLTQLTDSHSHANSQHLSCTQINCIVDVRRVALMHWLGWNTAASGGLTEMWRVVGFVCFGGWCVRVICVWKDVVAIAGHKFRVLNTRTHSNTVVALSVGCLTADWHWGTRTKRTTRTRTKISISSC